MLEEIPRQTANNWTDSGLKGFFRVSNARRRVPLNQVYKKLDRQLI